jgi:hypothetical protein
MEKKNNFDQILDIQRCHFFRVHSIDGFFCLSPGQFYGAAENARSVVIYIKGFNKMRQRHKKFNFRILLKLN